MHPTSYAAENLHDFARVTLHRHLKTGCDSRQVQFELVKSALIRDKSVTLDRADTIAAMVVADHEARDTDTRIDMDRSTSTCVFATVDGKRVAVSVRDIEAIVRSDA